MDTQQAYVIVGNGITGITAAEILRLEDPACSLTIVADDPFPAYYRPALKDFLGGHLPEEKLWARPATFYQERNIRFLPARVTGIDPQRHAIQLQSGQAVHYHKLLLANGARSRTLDCPGLHLAGVFTLRTVTDYQQILRHLEKVKRVVVCGSGTLALESAETLVQCGYSVTHLLRGQQLWSEVLDPIASEMVLQEEKRAGIEVRTQEEIAEIIGKNGEVCGVRTTRGERIPCELVLIAVGIEPALDFIRASGIACGRGIRVDSSMRTSSQDIYAAGDVIETTDALSGRTRLLGQWFPSIQQAQTAAYAMANAQVSLPTAPLYNATFLCGLDFVSIGLTNNPAAPGFQEIVAEPQARNYRKLLLYNGTLVGALLLGNRQQALALKRAIDHRVNIAAIAPQIFAEGFDLNAWLTSQNVPAPLLIHERNSQPEPAPANRQLTPVPETRTNPARRMPDALLRDLTDAPTLAFLKADGTSGALPLTYGRRYLLGRDPQNDIVLNDASISRQHAEISATLAGFSLRDLNSRYGVFLNQARITAETRLTHGDQIVVGNVLIYFSHPLARKTSQFAPLPVSSSVPPTPTPRDKEQVQIEDKPVVVGMEHRQAIEPLDEARLRFEIDMCIGCNRCMDACPVPGSSLITIASLNTATVTPNVAPEIARFTHECIMCGSCVPVCPVDNHRDLLMLSLKQRLGVSWKSQPNMQRVWQALPAGWSPEQVLPLLREQQILHDSQQVPDTYLLHMLTASQVVSLAAGETLLHEDEYGRDLFLILEGQLELITTDRDGREILVAILRRGEYAGEDGMLTGQPYKASARAHGPALLMQVPEQVMQRLGELAPDVRQHFERFTQNRVLSTILKRMELFEGIAEADLQAVLRRALVQTYERGERLFAEDRLGRPTRETLHILLEGFVKVARQTSPGEPGKEGEERIIAYRQGGDYFAGGLDLLGDGQAVTVTTINRCRVAEVPRQIVLALFQRYPHVEQRFAARMRDYLEAAASTQTLVNPTAQQTFALADPAVQDGLHSLVSDGVVEGTEVLVIDLDKCIHCNECEDACERRHGQSRMNRKGMVIGNISVATACRQCHDPVCLLCSRAGIARHTNGEVYITASCIGCGICAERCPYGAILIAPVEDEVPASGAWQRFSAWFSKNAGTESARRTLPMANAMLADTSRATPGPLDIFPVRSGYDELRKKIAIKCDLCAGYRDQACVQACPTGAALRIQPTRFFGSTEEILRRQTK